MRGIAFFFIVSFGDLLDIIWERRWSEGETSRAGLVIFGAMAAAEPPDEALGELIAPPPEFLGDELS